MNIIDGIITTILFLGYLILWEIKRKELMKSTGIDANFIVKAVKPIQKYFGNLENVMTIAVIIIIVAHTLLNPDTLILKRVSAINSTIYKMIGFAIGILGLTICRIAQTTIGNSWRVGIDENAKPGLAKNGIYRTIRNPTYSGLFTLCVGVLIINPTVLFLYWVLTFFIIMEFQVRCEEEYLEQIYGDEYIEYFKTTKRYVPYIY